MIRRSVVEMLAQHTLLTVWVFQEDLRMLHAYFKRDLLSRPITAYKPVRRQAIHGKTRHRIIAIFPHGF